MQAGSESADDEDEGKEDDEEEEEEEEDEDQPASKKPKVSLVHVTLGSAGCALIWVDTFHTDSVCSCCPAFI